MTLTTDGPPADAANLYPLLNRLPGAALVLRAAERAHLSENAAYVLWELWRNPLFRAEAMLALSDITSNPEQCLAIVAEHRAALELGSTRYVLPHAQPRDYFGKYLVRRGLALISARHDALEREIAKDVRARLASSPTARSAAHKDDLETLHALQKTAVFASEQYPFFVLTGGPGTGKTTVVRHILARAQASGLLADAIAIAAPTGKAADRLNQTLYASQSEVRAQTLHRLLGFTPQTRRFRYNGATQLPFSLIVVDEASMLDTFMMAALLRACRLDARIVLVGDPDQLPAVDGGEVLRDFLAVRAIPRVALEHNHRVADSAEGQAIAELATALRSRKNLASTAPLRAKCTRADAITSFLDAWMQKLAVCSSPKEALFEIERRRIVTILREPFPSDPLASAAGVNAVAQRLARTRGIAAVPVMVERNDAQLGLYNGDTGVWMRGEVFFLRNQELLRFAHASVAHVIRDAWAMTVHKAQGSEYEHVLFALPNRDVPTLLTRAILYTGVTRARAHLQIADDNDLFALGALRESDRETGLSNTLQHELASIARVV